MGLQRETRSIERRRGRGAAVGRETAIVDIERMRETASGVLDAYCWYECQRARGRPLAGWATRAARLTPTGSGRGASANRDENCEGDATRNRGLLSVCLGSAARYSVARATVDQRKFGSSRNAFDRTCDIRARLDAACSTMGCSQQTR